MESDPVALQHFELGPEPVPAEVLGAGAAAVPLDVMGNLARRLTEVYEMQHGATP